MNAFRFVYAGVCVAAGTAVLVGGAGTALAAPIAPGDFGAVPGRTAITFTDSHTGWTMGTGNQHQSRAGLSTVKLYMADYVLRHGDGSASDRNLTERMIRYSDDGAASQIYAKYPNSINGPAHEYGLANTRGAAHWGDSTTSTADTVKFLEAKKAHDPASPVLAWMRSAAPVAADGTHQNWGTAHLPGAEGTKWGWSDFGPSQANSATIGNGYSVAAATDGTGGDQTSDVLRAFITLDQPSPGSVALRDVVNSVVSHVFPGDPMGQWVVNAIPADIRVPVEAADAVTGSIG